MYASVIVDSDAPGLNRAFSYRVPDELEEALFEGACVAVPFSGREMVGYVYELSSDAPDIRGIKDISSVITEACPLNSSLMRLAAWISSYYVSSLSSVVRCIVPDIMSASVSTLVRLIDPLAVHPSSPGQQRLVSVLQSVGGECDSDILKARAAMEKYGAALRQLRDRGAVVVVRVLETPKVRALNVRGVKIIDDEDLDFTDELAVRAPRQAQILRELAQMDGPVRQTDLLRRTGGSTGSIDGLVRRGFAEKVDMRVRRRPFADREIAPRTDFDLTRGQEDALRIISEGFDLGEPQTTLLYGVTGSGKTEVYLRTIEQVLGEDRSCISLVPEISLTNHLMDAYRSTFGDGVAILHSGLSAGERHDEWRRIEQGEARVVLGARSAVFAPVKDLGLVVVDEEHEPSYKQDRSPRYNARTAAEQRAREEDASVILGSATPSLESFYRASAGDIRLAVLEKRIDDRPMPSVTVVDQRTEFQGGRRSVFSEPLTEAIAERLAAKQQIILFVNRRGYASFILCRDCGYVAKCLHCDVSLTYHSYPKMLCCHHCDAHVPPPTVCPTCGGANVRQFGIGTERVEEEAKKAFPEARVIRMDADTTRRKHSHMQLLDTFREGRADILVGTQMVAKGLDFHNVTLVGVISADTSLHLPDFRAAERTFQLLTQVSGRAGRGASPGSTFIQSFSPDHYAVRAAARQDYLGFYGQEIACRRELRYPPFTRLLNIVSSDPIEGYAEERLKSLHLAVEAQVLQGSVEFLGPAPAPLSRLKGLHRWHLVIKDLAGDGEVQSIVGRIASGMDFSSRVGLAIDVDPLTML